MAPNGSAELTELQDYFRDRSLDPDGGPFALAYAMLHLASSLDNLANAVVPTTTETAPGPDPPQSTEFLSHRRRARRRRNHEANQ